jgi:hypothetical protein
VVGCTSRAFLFGRTPDVTDHGQVRQGMGVPLGWNQPRIAGSSVNRVGPRRLAILRQTAHTPEQLVQRNAEAGGSRWSDFGRGLSQLTSRAYIASHVDQYLRLVRHCCSSSGALAHANCHAQGRSIKHFDHRQVASTPPSTGSVIPVMYPLAGLARNSSAAPISSCCPSRPNKVRGRTTSLMYCASNWSVISDSK